ncbi:hypothetical protein HDU98_008673 [Podochytrium sp. JEL0797]|nr:hypothetical protein HDU98_008673 [Podochytrium sp. JEL0797]
MTVEFSIPILACGFAFVAYGAVHEGVLDVSTPTAPPEPTWTSFTLPPETELRFESSPKHPLHLRLVSGQAELFGSELAKGVEYNLTAQKVAVFSYTGAKVELKGVDAGGAYVAGETPMQSYLNLHLGVEGVRRDAARFRTSANELEGPRVMVLGPPDVGKTSVCKILMNYSVKMGHPQMYVDLDVTETSGLSLPGTMAASVVSRCVQVEEGLGGTLVSSGTSPVVFYYGFDGVAEKPKVYEGLVERLAGVVERKLKSDVQIRTAGVIINTPSYFSETAGYPQLTHAIEQFKPTLLVVIGHERMYADLSRQYQQNRELKVLKLAKSGGVVTRDKSYRRAVASMKIREYFYGTTNFPLSPFSNTVSFHELHVRRIGDSTAAPTSALPIGLLRKSEPPKIVKVPVGDILLNSILAVTHADRLDALPVPAGTVSAPALTLEQETALILDKNVAGFVYVSEVVGGGEGGGVGKRQSVTVLAPNPGRLPKKYLMMGTLKWVETS